MFVQRIAAVSALAVLPVLAAPAAVPPKPAPPPAPAAAAFKVVAAGDIACRNCHDGPTAALARGLRPQLVLGLGDLQYPNGTYAEFVSGYARTWGSLKGITRPAPGNHEYYTPGAAGYFRYFGAAAGPGRRGYYSFNAGGWHFVSLNSNCAKVGGCGPSSPQGRWLAADLAANRARCTVAYWHTPRFSSGKYGSAPAVDGLWRTAYAGGVDLVLSAHQHSYERFAPLDASGRVAARGMREFVVGSGGAAHYPSGPPIAGSQRRDSTSWGVLELTLRPAGYAYRFVALGGKVRDAGAGNCR